MDTLHSMKVFAAVAEEGGFAAAAQRLDLSPPMVTRQVAALERQLGVRLLHRTTRRVALTDAGEAYLQRVRRILTDVEEAQTAVQQTVGTLEGVVRVLTSPVLSLHVLSPALAPFRALHPGVRIEVTVDAPGAQRLEDFDLTLLGASQGFDSGIVARALLQSRGVLVAAPSYAARHGLPAEPGQLGDHLCMRVKVPGWNPDRWVLQAEAPQTLPAGQPASVEVPVRPVVVANHTDTLLQATLDGAGISAHPMEIVARHLASGALQRVLPQWVTGRYTLYAALPSRQFVPRRVRALLDFLTERMAELAGRMP